MREYIGGGERGRRREGERKRESERSEAVNTLRAVINHVTSSLIVELKCMCTR